MDVEQHLSAFVQSFVFAAQQERWRLLLSQRGEHLLRHSAKLLNGLDRRYCQRMNGQWELEQSRLGVFCDFWGEPETITLEEAVKRGKGSDAIFSLAPGKLAIYFFHEGESWLCRR